MNTSKPARQHTLIGRKLIAFVIYSIALTAFAVIMSNPPASPENVIVQGMYLITYAGLLLIGGQAAIDSLVPIFGKSVDAFQRQPAKTTVQKEESVVKTETVKEG